MHRGILALFALTFIFIPKAFAAENPKIWFRVDPENNGPTGGLYARIEDILAGRSDQTAAKVWMKYDYSRDPSIRIRYSLALHVVNCVNRTYRTITSVSYMPDGTSIPGNPSGKTEFIIPQTNMEFVADMLCSDPTEPVRYQ